MSHLPKCRRIVEFFVLAFAESVLVMMVEWTRDQGWRSTCVHSDTRASSSDDSNAGSSDINCRDLNRIPENWFWAREGLLLMYPYIFRRIWDKLLDVVYRERGQQWLNRTNKKDVSCSSKRVNTFSGVMKEWEALDIFGQPTSRWRRIYI